MAGLIPAGAFADTVSVDIDRTIVLWATPRGDICKAAGSYGPGLNANEIWFGLTGKRRRYASWEEVKGLMLGWERRRAAAAQRDDEALHERILEHVA